VTSDAVGVAWDELIDWGEIGCAHGPANGVPNALDALAAASTEAAALDAYWKLDNVIVVQGSVYEAGPLTVEPLLRIVATAAGPGRRWALELLLQMVGGWTHPEERERLGRDLVEECRARSKAGLEVVYAQAAAGDADCRELACEIARSVETRPGELERRVRWLAARLDPSDAEYLLGLLEDR
jgi:hypothetical protein